MMPGSKMTRSDMYGVFTISFGNKQLVPDARALSSFYDASLIRSRLSHFKTWTFKRWLQSHIFDVGNSVYDAVWGTWLAYIYPGH
jgi:hypothetical protein